MKYLPFALAPLSLLISLPAQAAQEPVTNSKPLAEIVVSASRAQHASAQSLRVLTREQIEQSTATTLPDFLRQVPGIQIRSLFGTSSSEAIVDLGAFGPAAGQNTLILIDGRRQNDIDSSATDIGSLSLDQIERIEILASSGGVLYGDGAVGGTINIITRDQRKQSTRVKLAAGSYNTREAQLLHHFNNALFAGQVFVNNTDTDGYRQNGYVRRIEAGSKLQLDLPQNREAYASLLASRQDAGLPGFRSVTASNDQVKDSPRTASSPSDYGDTERLQATVGWRAPLTADTTVVLEGSHRQKQQRASVAFQYLDTRLDTTSLNPRVEHEHRLGGWSGRLSTGLDWQYSDYTSDRAYAEGMPPVHRIDIRANSLGGYAHETLRKGAHTVTAGVRETRLRLNAKDRYDPYAMDFDAEAAPYSETLKGGMYELAYAHQFNPSTSAGIGFARNVRLATVDDLFEGYGTGFFGAPRAFSPLRPQVGKNLSAHVRTRAGNADLSLEAFYHRLRDEIHFNDATFTNDNLDPTLRKGVALSAAMPLGRKTQLSTSATYQSATFRKGENAGKDVPLVSRYLGSVNLTHELSSRWQAGLSSLYTGSRYFENDDSNTFGRRAKAMIRSDANLRYRRGAWSITGTVRNLTDEKEQFDYAASSCIPFNATTAPPGCFSAVGKYNAYPLPGRHLLISTEYAF
ncbi:MAG: TonB-dependent receptor [Pseudomonadota bacterium]